MNNADFERYNAAKQSIRSLLDYAVVAQTKSQQRILQDREGILNSIYGHNKQTPRHLRVSLSDYFNGYYDAVIKNNVIFLYKVDGVFYKLGQSDQAHLNMPTWTELPRDMWGELGDYGGMYWKDSLVRFHKHGGE